MSAFAVRRPLPEAESWPVADPPSSVQPSSIEDNSNAAFEDEQIRRIRLAATHIWDTHREYLRALSLRWLRGNIAEAEDAVADVVYKASIKFALTNVAFTNERAWLTRVLHNRCMDSYRSVSRRQPFVVSHNGEPGGDEETRVPSGEDLLLNAELGHIIQRAFAELPPALRQPAVMRLMNNEPYASIAESLRITQTNTRKRIQLARQMLQDRLRTYLNGSAPARTAPTLPGMKDPECSGQAECAAGSFEKLTNRHGFA